MSCPDAEASGAVTTPHATAEAVPCCSQLPPRRPPPGGPGLPLNLGALGQEPPSLQPTFLFVYRIGIGCVSGGPGCPSGSGVMAFRSLARWRRSTTGHSLNMTMIDEMRGPGLGLE